MDAHPSRYCASVRVQNHRQVQYEHDKLNAVAAHMPSLKIVLTNQNTEEKCVIWAKCVETRMSK